MDGPRLRTEQVIEEVSQASQGAVPLTSSGQPLPGNEVQIVSESGETLAPGKVGEILIKSDSLFEGYFHRQDLTAQVMSEGWYRTGDLVFFSWGELFVVGRSKDMLIIGGENIYPQDIEINCCRPPGGSRWPSRGLGNLQPRAWNRGDCGGCRIGEPGLTGKECSDRTRYSCQLDGSDGRGGAQDFSESAKMDCKEHGRQGGPLGHAGKTPFGTPGLDGAAGALAGLARSFALFLFGV